MSKKFIQIYTMSLILLVILFGCASFGGPSSPGRYSTQKRIVRQGTVAVDNETRTAGTVSAVYFGYDRNQDYRNNNNALSCKGVDLVEYKLLHPDGHWDYNPFLIISDDDYDCYADRVWLDCNHDGILETVFALQPRSTVLELVDGKQVRHLKNRCQ